MGPLKAHGAFLLTLPLPIVFLPPNNQHQLNVQPLRNTEDCTSDQRESLGKPQLHSATPLSVVQQSLHVTMLITTDCCE